MLEDRVVPSSYTFVSLLKGCIKAKNLEKARELHVEAVRNGFENDPFVAATLVDMYGKFGLLPQAQEAFDKVTVRDSVTWNAIIGGYTEHGDGRNALSCYEKMQCENICSTHVTYLSVVKACSLTGDVEKGRDIHSEVVMRAVENNIFVNAALIDMYVKLASMKDAEKVFNSVMLRNTVSWNSLLAGYAEQGNVAEVLEFFEKMEQEGIFQDVVTFVHGLKACGNIEGLCKGQEIHTKITFKGFENDEVLDSMLLYMYVKCAAVTEARDVFRKLKVRDVVSWTTLISGYGLHGYDDEALGLFDEMRVDNVRPNSVTYATVLKSCSTFKNLSKGQKIHSEIAEEGYDANLSVVNALVGMYAKLGLMPEARDVFDSFPNRDLVLSNILLAGYAEFGPDIELLNCFSQIPLDGLCPDGFTLTCILKACGNLKLIVIGHKIHAQILLAGYEKDLVIVSMLVDMYSKCNCPLDACMIFEKSKHDGVLWNALITGLLDCGYDSHVGKCVEQMHLESIPADHGIYAGVLRACCGIGAFDEGRQIHTETLLKGYENNPFIGSGLVSLYVKCGAPKEAWIIFKGLPARDDVMWSVLLSGYVDNGCSQEALMCLEIMRLENQAPSAATLISILKACGDTGAVEKLCETHMEITGKGFEKEILVSNALVDTYGKCGSIEEAQNVFDALSVRDIASWNAMIKGFGINHEGYMAVKYFSGMLKSGIKPDATTFTCLLTACSRASLLFEGRDLFQTMSEDFDIVSTTDHLVCMVDLFARSGCLYEAEKLIETFPCFPSNYSWKTLLSASKTYDEPELGSKCFLQLVNV